MDADFEYSADKRRAFKRDIERGIISNEPDKFQMNDLMLGAVVAIAAVMSLTDFSLSWGDFKNLTALTIFLYIVTMFVYRNRYSKGIARGKTDEEYKGALKIYREKREKINTLHLINHVPKFCTDYKRKELREYRESLLCDVEIDYETYKSKYSIMSKKRIMRLPISNEAKLVLIKCNRAKAIKLFPGVILNESGEYDRQKLIGKSGREREKKDKRNQAISRAVYVIFASAIAFDVIFNFSALTIVQWIVRMMPVVLAIMSGEDGGYCNVTVTETNFKRDQSHVIDLLFEYARDNNLITEETSVVEVEEKIAQEGA